MFALLERSSGDPEPALSSVEGVKGAPPSLPGAGKVRFVAAGKKRWLVCCDAPLNRYGEDAINAGLKDMDWVSERAMAHEAVVEFAMSQGTVVPMKLFTLFHSDERAVAQLLADPDAVDEVLRRLRGCEELGVRISVDDARAAMRVGGTPAVPAISGAAFLARKKQVRDSAQEAARRTQRAAEDGFETLAALAEDARKRPLVATELGSARLLLDGAFLVKKTGAKKFRAAAEKLGQDLGGAYTVTVTGPWPPYNFIQRES